MQNASPYRLCCILEHTPLQFGDHSGYKFRFKIDCLHFYLHRLQEVEQQHLMYRLVRQPPIILLITNILRGYPVFTPLQHDLSML